MKTYKKQWIYELTKHIQELDKVIANWAGRVSGCPKCEKNVFEVNILLLQKKRAYLHASRLEIKYLEAYHFVPKRFPDIVYNTYQIRHPEIAKKIAMDKDRRDIKKRIRNTSLIK